LGPVYGFQWRHFGAEYVDADTDYTGKGVDQLREVIRKIKEDPTDRRIIMSAWNPAGLFTDLSSYTALQSFVFPCIDVPLMALPPCHMMCQFYVHLPNLDSGVASRRLSCLMYQRSADLGLGIPFNIASYALLTHMIARVTDTVPHELIIQLGDAHVYKDHVEELGVQLSRQPRAFPTLRWLRDITDIDDFTYDDFIVEGYKPHPAITMNMSV
jgi:thymidylate synthase